MKQVLVVLLVAMTIVLTNFLSEEYSKCEFKAIFNFGDSNSDTGGYWAAFPAQSEPFGMTYFKKPSGRMSDGRVIVDFLAEALGLPFISPYLQSIGSDFRHGANYATAGSEVLSPNNFTPFTLAIQLNQMKDFRTKVIEEFDSGDKQGSSKLPSPDIFGKSLYTIYIGHNDFTKLTDLNDIEGVKQKLDQVVSQIAATVTELYGLGGRTFFVLNLAPLGCYPQRLVTLPHNPSDLDEFGCLISYNKLVVDYNIMLKNKLNLTRTNIPNASLIYVDTHAVLLELFQHPTSHGLRYGTKACCGYGGGIYNFHPMAYCGLTNEINGINVTATACNDPLNYVSWDGLHATEAANKLTALAILNGSCFDPPFPLHEFCDLHPIIR